MKKKLWRCVTAFAVAGVFFLTPPLLTDAVGWGDYFNYTGSIRLFAGEFAPSGWAFCEGQEIPTNQNPALFSLLGTTYGGDGYNYFKLPDLRGRVPMHFGSATESLGPGDYHDIGQAGGKDNVTLSDTQWQLQVESATIDSSIVDSTSESSVVIANPSDVDGAQPFTLSHSAPHNNMQPYLPLRYIICLYGIYPSWP